MTDRAGAKLEITYKGAHASRPADVIDVDEFVGVKSHRAKGKRLTTYDVDRLRDDRTRTASRTGTFGG